MINPIYDKLIPLKDVPKLKWLQREDNTKRINISTVYRWSQGSPTGCALETILMPWGKCTTEDAIRTFLKVRNRPYYIPPPHAPNDQQSDTRGGQKQW